MVNFNFLLKKLKSINTKIYMLIGNGSKNQFRYISDLKNTLKKILKNIPKKSCFLYFGDGINKKKPDIGYAFKLINDMRPDINIFMIQIAEAKSWGVPKFVKEVYWHKDYTNNCKWGGILNGKPCSNTKKWVNIHNRIGIETVFILGGGKITLDEYKLIKKLKINYEYFIIERRFLGDGKTKINNNNAIADKIGLTNNKIL
tara:strand:+ start:1465 stop:2067 length:603 start_codon:yes stop_codon:yes gene_type:complete